MRINSDNNGLFVNGEYDVRERNGNNFFAGNMNKVTDSVSDRIDKKRKQAQAQAMKLIGDVFARDRKIDDGMARLEDEAAKLLDENGGLGDSIKNNIKERHDLMDEYGVSQDSQEQIDLELLEKREESRKHGITLSDEENERLAGIDANGLTEYQARSMELYNQQSEMRDRFDDNKAAAEGMLGAVRNLQTERLKSNEMIDAQKAAEELNNAASKEIVGMLVDDARTSIDDKIREEKEKAEEKAEEKSEKEKKEENKNDNVSYDGIKEAQKEIQKIVDRMELLDEDIKGARVDTTL